MVNYFYLFIYNSFCVVVIIVLLNYIYVNFFKILLGVSGNTGIPGRNAMMSSAGVIVGGTTLTRPRPQPIAGTPPPDPNEKCDQKMIQQTCTLFGLDLVSFH